MWFAIGRALVWAFAGIQSYQFAQPILRFFGFVPPDPDDPEPPRGSTVALWLVLILLVFGFALFLLRASGTFGRPRYAGE
jgi:hypothetical protein